MSEPVTATVAAPQHAVDVLLQRLDGWRHLDLSVKILRPQIAVSSFEINISGNVNDDDGRRVGYFQGYIVPAAEQVDSWTVLNHIELDPVARGRDFTRALVARISDTLLELGLRRLVVHGFGVGAYLWAGSGFRFDHPGMPGTESAVAVLERARDAGAFVDLDAADQARLAALEQAAEADPDTPAIFLTFADHASAAERSARAALVRRILVSSHWWGVKELVPSTAGPEPPGGASTSGATTHTEPHGNPKETD